MANGDTQMNAVENALGVRFVDRSLLAEALVPRTFQKREGGEKDRVSHDRNNQILAELGDGFLRFVVREHIFRKYADVVYERGNLQEFLDLIVSNVAIAEVARGFGLDRHVQLEQKSFRERHGQKDREWRHLANVLEAIVGAVYLDQGFESAKSLVAQLLSKKIDEVMTARYEDPLRKVIALVHIRFRTDPTFPTTLVSSSPSRMKAECIVNGNVIGVGYGSSRTTARLAAAQAALEFLTKEPEDNRLT